MLGTCTGYERDMFGICLGNISRWSNPLHIAASRDLRDMLEKKDSPLLMKGLGVALSIVCLYPNDRAPIAKRSVAYTQIET